MMYNTYTLEKMAYQIQKDRIDEAKKQSRWQAARKSLQNLSNPRSSR
jgi:hypothetical protein